ncbi:hypothetical protein Bca52824_069640 [Brassica carinata]|uniref:PABS domain-containing protein n=1 Tax=Brassica carinata TaxID=52824 RepID=A0A8X7U340_BRACI|nr:hypothetical protein Bca52824_069640 [Brassica carinata]
MALDVRIFETVSPSRFISFTIPNPNSPSHLLRVAVLDSPIHSSDSSPRVAAMLVPKHRETDWIFSTESGHLQLLLNLPNISPLSPKTLFKEEVPFLIYEDDVVSRVELERTVGPYVGEMVIEDVEIEIDEVTREFRRRLRFKRMPNLVQSDVKLVRSRRGEEFEPQLTELVHPYLAPMVASLSLIGSEMTRRPKALCIGVGGGGLLSFLKVQLGFEVTGVEIDPEVLRIARRYFGLEERFASVHVGDGVDFLKRLDDDGSKFDVLMVDLDSSDPVHGVSAPPVEFVAKDVLLAARAVLVPCGVLVINVIPLSKTFYEELKDVFRRVFAELYEIDVGNGENFVLVATVSIRDGNSGFSMDNLAPVILKYVDAIQRI